MDKSPLERLIDSNQPFRLVIATGRVLDIPNREFVSLSPRKTALFVSYEENGQERFVIVPLLAIKSATATAPGREA